MNKIFLTAPVLMLSLAAYADSTKADTANAGDQPTAQDQKNDKTDLDLTAQIRRAVVSDKTLSITAHNVKIIARNGVVTLRGAVKSNIERTVVSEKAKDIAGATNVVNELKVEK